VLPTFRIFSKRPLHRWRRVCNVPRQLGFDDSVVLVSDGCTYWQKQKRMAAVVILSVSDSVVVLSEGCCDHLI
jgi:hypothetical protein